jgi:uncharacterized coiled-coil DUF342 family protein
MSEQNTDIELLRKKIGELGASLEKLGTEKESLYKEKQVLEDTLSNTINSAKELKAKKAAIDAQIKEKKVVRTTLNKEIKDFSKKISEVKRVNPNFKRGPSVEESKRQIESMQYAIETEGLSFEREKNYMDKIKQLKARLAEIEKASGHTSDVGILRESLTTKKTGADTAHAEVQTLADESTKLFNILTDKAKEIDVWKQKRRDMQENLKRIKTQIEENNAILAETLNTWMEVAKTAPPIPAKAAESITSEEIFLKFKSAKKLTKEDILKLQRLANKDHGRFNKGSSG